MSHNFQSFCLQPRAMWGQMFDRAPFSNRQQRLFLSCTALKHALQIQIFLIEYLPPSQMLSKSLEFKFAQPVSFVLSISHSLKDSVCLYCIVTSVSFFFYSFQCETSTKDKGLNKLVNKIL